MPTEIHHIEDPPGIRGGDNRPLLLTLRLPPRVVRTNPELAEDLLVLAHAGARQIIQDADNVIKGVAGIAPSSRLIFRTLWRPDANGCLVADIVK